MLALLRQRTAARLVLAALAILAVAMKLMVPAGYMPGTSLAAPIVLCPDQAPPKMQMAHGGHHASAHHSPADHAPDRHSGDGGGHACAFAGLGLAAFDAPIVSAAIAPPPAASPMPAAAGRDLVVGQGLAAPPPRSRAPPVRHA